MLVSSKDDPKVLAHLSFVPQIVANIYYVLSTLLDGDKYGILQCFVNNIIHVIICSHSVFFVCILRNP